MKKKLENRKDDIVVIKEKIGYANGFSIGFIRGMLDAINKQIHNLILFFGSRENPTNVKVLKVLYLMLKVVNVSLTIVKGIITAETLKVFKQKGIKLYNMISFLPAFVIKQTSVQLLIALIIKLNRTIDRYIQMNSVSEFEERLVTRNSLVDAGITMTHMPWAYKKDAGVKGMKKGEHRMAKDPDYVASLKGGRTIRDLEESPFSNLIEVRRVLKAYRSAQEKLNSVVLRRDSKYRLKKKLVTDWSNKNNKSNNKKIRNNRRFERMQQIKREALKNTRQQSKRSRLSIKSILGAAVLSIVISTIVKKIRNAIKASAALKKNAEQNNTDQRYIQHVEQLMRTGQYNETAVVESIKSQIIPLLEKEVNDNYRSGEITNEEYQTYKRQIQEIASSNRLEDIYSVIKNPIVQREIIAYRAAKDKIEKELQAMQNQMAYIQNL